MGNDRPSGCTTSVFISAASAEFESLRNDLHERLNSQNIHVITQQYLVGNGRSLLTLFDDIISNSDIVIHLIGNRSGGLARGTKHGVPQKIEVDQLRQEHGDVFEVLRLTKSRCRDITFTHWEALLARYRILKPSQTGNHNLRLFVFSPISFPQLASDIEIREARRQLRLQKRHFTRLSRLGVYKDGTFCSSQDLTAIVFKHLLETAKQTQSAVQAGPQVSESVRREHQASIERQWQLSWTEQF